MVAPGPGPDYPDLAIKPRFTRPCGELAGPAGRYIVSVNLLLADL